MRQFYSLSNAAENRIGNALELESYELNTFYYNDLKRTRPLGALPDIQLVVRAPKANAVDANVIVNCLGWIIVAEELATCFKSVAGDDVEILEVPIHNEAGEMLGRRFFVINALKRLDALSPKLTVRSRVMIGKSQPVLELGLDSRRIPESAHIFRVDGYDYALVVDNILKTAIAKHWHEGLAFNPLQHE